jgi:hypothetical protein
MKMHGGNVHIEDGVKGGAVFTLQFRLSEAAVSPMQVVASNDENGLGDIAEIDDATARNQ